MKTLFVVLGVVGVLSLGSCKKDWTCECVDDNGDKSYSTIPESTLSDAKETCDDKEYNLFGSKYQNCSVEP